MDECKPLPSGMMPTPGMFGAHSSGGVGGGGGGGEPVGGGWNGPAQMPNGMMFGVHGGGGVGDGDCGGKGLSSSPDFVVVYSFLADLFDPHIIGHKQKLKVGTDNIALATSSTTSSTSSSSPSS